MRPIDADALKDKARELIPNYHASVVMNLFDLIDNLVDNMPTIEALQGRKAWELFDLITSAYYGKMMYSRQENGIIYSRYSCKYMTMDDALNEFLSLLSWGGEE